MNWTFILSTAIAGFFLHQCIDRICNCIELKTEMWKEVCLKVDVSLTEDDDVY